MAAATLKLNIANPSTGRQLKIDLEDEKQKRIFYEKRLSQEVEGDALGEAWKGYIFKILGGNDKEGFPMMQGVLQPKRVRLLLDKNSQCYRQRRTGERKRKSIRGCIVGPDISVLHLVVAKKGAADVPGLCDKAIPRRLGPKRASKIRKLFNLSKADDVRQYVIRREIAKEGKKKQFKAPKIQRLVTPRVLQRKRHRFALKKKAAARAKTDKAEFHKLLAQRNKQKRAALISKKRSESTKGSVKDVKGKEDPKAQKSAAKGKEDPKAKVKAAAKTAATAKATAKAPAAAKGGKAPAKAPAAAKGGKAPATGKPAAAPAAKAKATPTKTAAAPAKTSAGKKPAATKAAGKATKKA